MLRGGTEGLESLVDRVVRFAGTLQVPFAGLKVPALQPSSLQVTEIVICALQLPFVVPK